MDWTNICALNQGDLNTSCSNFFNNITYQLDEMAPFKKVKRKEYDLFSKPWISREILNKCKRKEYLLKKISKEKDLSKLTELRNEYKRIRNEITVDKRRSKKKLLSLLL